MSDTKNKIYDIVIMLTNNRKDMPISTFKVLDEFYKNDTTYRSYDKIVLVSDCLNMLHKEKKVCLTNYNIVYLM
jgi:hypothetical protein